MGYYKLCGWICLTTKLIFCRGDVNEQGNQAIYRQ